MPYQKVPGVITRQGIFEVAGFDMTHMTEETAALAAAGPREAAEYRGMCRVTKLLQEGVRQAHDPTTVRVVQFSPAKDLKTNYGLCIYYEVGAYDNQLQGHRVTEKILRYDEDYGDTRASRKLYAHVQHKAQQPINAFHLHSGADFLLNPILMYSNARLDREIMQDVFHVDTSDIDFTEEFEKRALRELQPLFHGYISLALGIVSGQIQASEAQVKELEGTLSRIFYWSKEIGKRMKERGLIGENEKYVDIYAYDAYMHYRQARDRGELVLHNGTNCPTVKRSIYSIAEKQTILCCVCPVCKRKVEARISNGKITCNLCGAEGQYDPNKAKKQENDDVLMSQSPSQTSMGQIVDFPLPGDSFDQGIAVAA